MNAHPATAGEQLNQLLADEYILLTKTRNCYWQSFDVAGSEMRKSCEQQMLRLQQMVNDLDACLRRLGRPAIGSLREFLEWTRLHQGWLGFDSEAQAAQLLGDHETLCHQIRHDLHSLTGTNYAGEAVMLLNRFLSEHEHMAWTLRASLQQHSMAA